MATTVKQFSNPNSSNYQKGARKGPESIKFIVLHYTTAHSSPAGRAERTAEHTFNGIRKDGLRVSSDYIVDDGTILQYVPDIDHNCSRAIPNSNGLNCANSINIEMESSYNGANAKPAPNDPGWYFTEAVLRNTLALCKSLVAKYNIPKQNIKRHYDVNGKLCPGVVGWNPKSGSEDKFNAFVNAIYGGSLDVTPANIVNSSEVPVTQDTTSPILMPGQSLNHPYPWESDSDIKHDSNGRMYSEDNLIEGIIRFRLNASYSINPNNDYYVFGEAISISSSGQVLNSLDLTINESNKNGEYHLVLWRYNKVPSRGGHNALEGVIYEYDTNNVLTYTIEDEYDVKNNKETWQNGKDIDTIINPGGGTWPSDPRSPYHWGCSMYCCNLAKGRGGFGKTPKAPMTMLRAGNRGCLFHPGADVTWSEGCVLCGEKAQNGRRNVISSEYTMEKITTSTNKDVLWWKNLYNHVVPVICEGRRVILHVRTQLGSMQSSSASFTSSGSGLNSPLSEGTGLTSIKQALINASLSEYVIINPIYATTNNFGNRIMPGYKNGQNDLYLGKKAMKKLIEAVNYMKNKYPNNKLMIWDAYRPWQAADAFCDIAPQYVGTYLAKLNGTHSNSAHCKGAAIDLTLCNASGKPLPMTNQKLTCPWAISTGGFDEFSKAADTNPNHPNQKILRDIMLNGGKFDSISNEYWHFQNGKGKNLIVECDGSTNY